MVAIKFWKHTKYSVITMILIAKPFHIWNYTVSKNNTAIFMYDKFLFFTYEFGKFMFM